MIGGIGKLNIKVEVTGRSAHASQPDQGVNAVYEAAKLIGRLEMLDRQSDPVMGKATHCVLNISSGTGAYEIRVPDHCTFLINWHFTPKELAQTALALLQQMADALHSPAEFRFTVVEPHYPSWTQSEDSKFIRAFAASYLAVLGHEPQLSHCYGVSDANLLVGLGSIPTILFGPGGGNMHAANEWVDLEHLENVCAIYYDVALRMMPNK